LPERNTATIFAKSFLWLVGFKTIAAILAERFTEISRPRFFDAVTFAESALFASIIAIQLS